MKHGANFNNVNYLNLYQKTLPSSRGGKLYRAFSYPTKISPEAIALFIATHTKVGDTILDSFGGSGTTGLAAILCENPSKKLIKLAEERNLKPEWGPRKVILYEIGVLGSFISQNLCNPPNPENFVKYANELIGEIEDEVGHLYTAIDNKGEKGKIRYSIWTDFLYCPKCGKEVSFWESAVTEKPANISKICTCPKCKHKFKKEDAQFVTEEVHDPILQKSVPQRKRRLTKIYGQTGNKYWSRKPTLEDEIQFEISHSIPIPNSIPNFEIEWGDLLRTGYHFGISHVHHFYSVRNLIVVGKLFEKINKYPTDIQSALRFLVSSYNASHSTIMARVVVKSGQSDFVLTGAQTGVLYVSSLPVEKNILEGLKRKIKTISAAFSIAYGHKSEIDIVNASSEKLKFGDETIDYVFTDPPFGDYIPYSEINMINEAWLGKTTNSSQEIIISRAQGKSIDSYKEMMTQVFSEIARVLKPSAKMTLIFHSAKSSIWKAIINAFSEARLFVEASSILNKLQASFKQTNSRIAVQGDPMILLSKNEFQPTGAMPTEDIDTTLVHLIEVAKENGNLEEINERRLYSQYVGHCLENNTVIPVDAKAFYPLAKKQLQEYG